MEKDIFTIKENALSYGRGYVYSLQYHLVWCTKYRKQVLKNGIDAECKKMLYELAEEYKFKILAMEVMPDHIHLLLDCKPQFFISDMIKIMKGNLARQLFLSHPELKQELWGGHLWNPSYCAVTVSDRSRDQVVAYIEGQKEKEKEVGNFMQIVSSYGVEIKKRIYRSALRWIFSEGSFLSDSGVCRDLEELSEIRNPQKRFNEAEHLVHETKKNHARFLFDRHFPKMPSYLRRAAIQHALGAVSSYQTRLSLWEKGELRGKPKLVCENHAMPVFYRDVMYKEAEPGEDVAHLKLFDGREWKWFQVKLLYTDMEYLRKNGVVKRHLPNFGKETS